MKKKPKNIPSPYKSEGTPIYRDTTALPFLDGGPLVDKTNHGKLLNSVYASALGNYYAQGGMLKRADGSYSPRGLWDNIRDNAGSGKKPTKQMLAQEKKINREYREGGQFPRPYSLPEDSFKQGGDNLHNSVYASSPAQYPAVYKYGGSFDMPRQQMYMPLDNVERYGGKMYRDGGSVFYATNTPQLEGEGKDLTYPENAYIYASGGLINNYNTGGNMNFKSNAAYKAWLAYGHASGEFAKTPGNQPVSIKGESHKVKHNMGGNLYAAGGSFNNPGFNALPPDVQNKIRTNSFQYGGTMNQLNKFDKGGPLSEKANMIYNSPFTGNYPSPYVGLVPLEGQEDVYLSGDINARAYNQAMEDRGVSDEERLKYQHEELQKLMQFRDSQEFALGGPITSPKKLFSSYVPTTKFNEGGTMDQLTEFKTGGKHEENPLGGIPQGRSRDGRLNLVEEGEMKRKPTAEGGGNDAFIYSDSIIVDKEFAKLYAIPKSFIGKTYAEAAKLAGRPDSRRENDTIEQSDIKRKLDSIADAQEAQKAKMEQEENAQKLAANPELLNALMGQLATNQSVQPMGMPQGEQVFPDQVPPEMLAQMEGAQQGMPIMRYGGNIYRCGGKMYDFGGFMDENSGAISGAGTGALSGAATGATIGSVVPGIGTAIGAGVGAVVGGVSGFLGGRKKDQAEEQTENEKNRAMAQQNSLATNMQNPTYVTPAAQAALQGSTGAGATMPYAYAKQGGWLQNLYANGGPITPPPGSATSPASSPGSPYIATYVPTLPSDYAKDYKRRAQEFKNNPIDPKTGAPSWGSGTEDAMSTGTGGDYIPITAAERAARIKELEAFNSGAVTPEYLEEYLTLKTNKPYFKATYDPNKTMYGPYDLSTYKPTVPTTTTAPATTLTPGTPPVGYMRSANTGQLMPNRENFDEAGNVFQVDRQYSQYLEEFANSPEQIAKRKNIAEQQITNPALLKLMTEEQKAEARQLKQTASEYFEKKGLPLPTQETEISFKDGGMLMQSFDPTLMPVETNTRMLRQAGPLSGGPYNNLGYILSLANLDKTVKKKKRNNAYQPELEVDETVVDENYTDEDRALDEMNLKDLQEKLNSGTLTQEEYNEALGEYKSVLKRINPKLDQQDMDFSVKAHPAELAAMALPAAYNIGMGLFGKPQQFDAQDYQVAADIAPWQYNVNPEYVAIQQGFAGAQDALRNTGLSGGAYASNIQNLNNLRNEQISELLTKKQNLDAEKYMQAQIANKELTRQNLGSQLAIQDANARALAAKQGILSKGLEQVGGIGSSMLNMRGQLGLVKATAPDFASSLNLGILPWKKPTTESTKEENKEG